MRTSSIRPTFTWIPSTWTASKRHDAELAALDAPAARGPDHIEVGDSEAETGAKHSRGIKLEYGTGQSRPF
jgi:hypothetical protein